MSDSGWGREIRFLPQTETTVLNTETNADSSKNQNNKKKRFI